jgi:hypothetical protein
MSIDRLLGYLDSIQEPLETGINSWTNTYGQGQLDLIRQIKHYLANPDTA